MSVLEKIDSPADLKKVSNQELEELASEIRTAVLHKVKHRWTRWSKLGCDRINNCPS